MGNEAVVKVEHLTQRFGKRTILHDISIDLQTGEILGLLGPSGSGKTTLVRAIAGIGEYSEGQIRVLGEEIPSLRVVSRIGYMAQADALYQDLTGLDNLTFFADMYGVPKKRQKNRIEEVLELVQLKDAAKRPVHTYSGGMKRRLSLAIALLHEPDILILDEPTVGVDPVLRKNFWEEFRRLQEIGVSLLITTHAMDEAEHCDRLGLIRDGRLIAFGKPAELKEAAGSQTIEGVFLYFGGVRP